MSDNETPKKLTVKDPVKPEVVKRLGQIINARSDASNRLADLEMAKVKLLVMIKQMDDERDRIFHHELTSRGISPDTQATIDGDTGVIELLVPEVQR